MDRPNISKSDIPEDTSISEPHVVASDDWVHELIALTRPGVEINLPMRGLSDRVIPFQFDDFS